MKSVLTLALLVMTSCVSVKTADKISLVGEWRYADKTQSCHYIFNKDGNFTGEVIYRGEVVSKFRGRWAIRGDVLFYTYLGDALGRIPSGVQDQDKLLSIQKDSFLIEAADGSQRRYIRIP